MDLSIKTQHMVDWVTKAHKLIVESGINKSMIREAVALALGEGRIVARGGLAEFVELLKSIGVPLLVFSAGIADVLENVILQTLGAPEVIPAHVHVISNRCVFNEEGRLIDFSEPSLHVLNKLAEPFLDTPFFAQSAASRKNVLLLGDSLGDCNMSRGMGYETILRVGFLNDRVEERLDSFLEEGKFDLVILGDPDLGVPIEILKEF